MQRSTPLALAILIATPALATVSTEMTRANPPGPTVVSPVPLEAEPEEHPADRPVSHAAGLALGPIIPTGTEAEPIPEPAAQASVQASAQADAPAEDPEPEAENPSETAPQGVERAEQSVAAPAERAETISPSDSIPLGQPRNAPSSEDTEIAPAGTAMADNWLIRTAGALAVVIGLILGVRFVLQWIDAKTNGGSAFASGARAPSGLVEVLARYTVSRGTKLLLLKIDSRILVVSQTSGEMHTLSEITNPDEVASILIKSRDEEGESLAGQFTRILRGLESDPSVVNDPVAPQSPRRALVSSQEDDYEDSDDETASPCDGASILRDRLSRFGDLSA